MRKKYFPIFCMILVFYPFNFHVYPENVTPRLKESAEYLKINRLIDDFHRAASEADGQRYFGYLSDDAVFMGTDPDERWTKEQFRQYAMPYFSSGRGWAYSPKERHLTLAPGEGIAWFDEKLDNKKYGQLRGTGVLKRGKKGWKIVFYNMGFTIPNELANKVVAIIKK